MNKLRQIVLNTAVCRRRTSFKQTFSQQLQRWRSTVEKPPTEQLIPQNSDLSIPQGILGQPTYHTHPHLITLGYLTCGVSQTEYKERRETLVNKLVAEVNNVHKTHIIVIPGACKQYMSDKIPYVFRQNTDFFYLTGCLEPSAILVMVKPAQTENFKTILFVHEKDNHAELWEGPRTGSVAAVKLFAVDESRPIDNFANFINKITVSSKPSILWYQNDNPANPEIHSTVRSVLRPEVQVTLADPQKTLHFMRVIKSAAEVQLMKDVCYIGSQSVNMAMASTKPGVSEQNVAAVLEYGARMMGGEHAAFPPVVAGGARATHIHYIANNQILQPRDMLLVDSGTQRWLYNSDISRTWPVTGKFTKHHRILYELVLTVQKRLTEILKEQRPPLDRLFDQMCRLLGTHLQQEGILPKNIDGNDLIGKAYQLCPHHVSHYLGLDVHDTSLVRRHVPLRPNMCVTVEPGIYIRPDDDSIPEEFRGVGIRVEDDVLITDNDVIILTESCVKEVDDIEAIVGKHTV